VGVTDSTDICGLVALLMSSDDDGRADLLGSWEGVVVVTGSLGVVSFAVAALPVFSAGLPVVCSAGMLLAKPAELIWVISTSVLEPPTTVGTADVSGPLVIVVFNPTWRGK